MLLILDEIQCGMGRTGTMFAWQDYGVKPDIMAMAKAIGGGVPVGAFAMTEKVAEKSLAPGDHGTTYGGNPFVCAAVSAVLDISRRKDLRPREEGGRLPGGTAGCLAERKESVEMRRGKGLMQGLVLNVPVGEVVVKAQKEGLLVITAGGNVLRMVPPLIITEEHVDEMIESWKKYFKSLAEYKGRLWEILTSDQKEGSDFLWPVFLSRYYQAPYERDRVYSTPR